MENIDIKDFHSVSAVSELDNILLVKISGKALKIKKNLFRAPLRDDITPHISGNTWWVGTVDTGVAAAGQTPEEAEAEFLTDAYFDAWYDQTLAALSAFTG